MTEQVPTVWVAHDRGQLDFSQLKQFGEARPVFGVEFNPFNVRDALAAAVTLFAEKSRANDFLVMAGNGVACALALSAYQARWGKAQLLIFHAGKRQYFPREIIAPSKFGGEVKLPV